MSRLITVSNRLPVREGPDGTIVRSSGGLASALAAVADEREMLWIGWPGREEPDPKRRRRRAEVLRAEHGCEPVELTEDLVEGFYTGYANGSLWPVLHYKVPLARFRPAWFEAYRAANREFARVVLDHAADDDIVWIHDYQLMLLPALIREERPDLRIGFFLHVPFPSYEIFRCLPERDAMVTGPLGADLIGFHTFGYLRHFRSSLLRLLGVESDPGLLELDGRPIRLGVYPIGHDRQGFEEAMNAPGFGEQSRRLGEELGRRRLVLSVERLDYTKGIPEKLDAIEWFLEHHAEHREDVQFLIIAVPSRQSVDAYRELTEEVQLRVAEINGRYSSFGHVPVNFYFRGTDQSRLATLYARAEVALVTPLIDGMNLVAKEFVAAHEDGPESPPGTLILSEFAGAAEELPGAILVNPYDPECVGKAIARALAGDPDRSRSALAAMREYVIENDARAWARRFLRDLVEDPVPRRDLASEPAEDLLGSLPGRPGTRALFLDYDGTLRDFTSRPNDALPEPELLRLLRRLGEAGNVRIAIVSGRDSAFLGEHFGELDTVLVSEHGYRWRRPGGDWEAMNPEVDTSWKSFVRPVLEHAARRTPGSEVEEKASALVWHYRRSDPEFGAWRASTLRGELTEVAANLPVEVHHGNKIVEVGSQQVSKGAAVRRLIDLWQPVWALAVGDDQTDETMFRIGAESEILRTLKIGAGPTRARYRLPTPARLRDFLAELAARLEASA